MSGISRRGMLRVGSAGAVGAVGAVTRGGPAWSWSPAGSVAGYGDGADPRWVWDEAADQLMADVIDRGDVPAVNALLRTWTTNSQPLPAGLPADVRAFMEEARQLPSWASQSKLAASYTFTTKRGLYLGVLYGLGSGMMSTAIPHEARAVYYSKGGADLKDRISKTAKLGYDIGTKDAFGPDGEMIVTCVKTRMVHAAVRHLLPQSGHWQQTADQTIPISQRDMMVTWHSLASFSWQKLTAWRLRIPAAEADGFLHSWQLTAHLLGIRDEYIPATWGSRSPSRTPCWTPSSRRRPKASISPTLSSTWPPSSTAAGRRTRSWRRPTRYLLGDELTDSMAIPRNPYWDKAFRNTWPQLRRVPRARSRGAAGPGPVLGLRRVPAARGAVLPLGRKTDQHRDPRYQPSCVIRLRHTFPRASSPGPRSSAG